MGMSYLEAARIMMGGGSGNVGPKPDNIEYNGTYVAEDDDLDGYTQVVVALPLGGATFTENRSYTPPDNLRGWSSVTVNVKTWKDEYDAMMECCQDVAEILGAEPEPGQSCCDAVKGKAEDVMEQIAEDDECKAKIIATLQQFDPNFNPQTCEDIVNEIPEVAGYEPPGDPPREDVIDAIAPLGGGDVDTVGTGTVGNYTYHIEFAGFTVNGYTMRDPIVDQPINDIVYSTLYAGYDEGQWHAGDGNYIFPVIKITIDGVGWGYAAAPGFLNGGGGWPVVCDSEWKFGIEDITAYNNEAGHRVITTFYPSGAGWTDYGIYFGGNTVTKDGVVTKVYTSQ